MGPWPLGREPLDVRRKVTVTRHGLLRNGEEAKQGGADALGVGAETTLTDARETELRMSTRLRNSEAMSRIALLAPAATSGPP